MADAPKRSSRTKKATDKVRKFDGHMRSEIRKKKLDALEQDNWQEEKPRVEEEEDEDYMDEDDEDVAVGTSKKSNKKKKKQKRDIWNATQKCKPLQVARRRTTGVREAVRCARLACALCNPAPPPRRSPAAGNSRRGAVSSLPVVGAHVGVDRRRAVQIPAAPLLLGHRPDGQVPVPRDGRVPSNARSVEYAPRDAAEGTDLERMLSVSLSLSLQRVARLQARTQNNRYTRPM
eukprot:1442617-Prymnesium_polylepis.1